MPANGRSSISTARHTLDGSHRAFQDIQWEKTVDVRERKFTANELIDAWYRGQKDALQEDMKLKIRTLEENVQKLNTVREDIYNFLQQRNLEPVGAFLRPESWSVFRMIIVVTEDTFLSDEFLSVFSYVRSKEEELASNALCNLSITFLEGSSILDVNVEHLISDGFLLEHALSDESPEPSAA